MASDQFWDAAERAAERANSLPHWKQDGGRIVRDRVPTKTEEVMASDWRKKTLVPRVYVVEQWNEDRGRWEPTVGVGLTLLHGRRELAEWRARNDGWRYRLRRYWDGDWHE